MVSNPGYIALVSGSSMPANDYIPDGGLDNLGESDGPVKGSTIIIITILLLIITLPASYQLFQLMRFEDSTEEE